MLAASEFKDLVGHFRFCPHRALPEAVFLPGLGLSKPEAANDAALPPLGAEWWEFSDWLWGVDLFNHGFCWEAHEAWEAVWKFHPRDSAEGLFLRGCIQYAAALVKLQLGIEGGVTKLSKRSLETLSQSRKATEASCLWGVEVESFIIDLERYWGKCPSHGMGTFQPYPRLWPGQEKLRELLNRSDVDSFLSALDRSLNSNSVLLVAPTSRSLQSFVDGPNFRWQMLLVDQLRDWCNFHIFDGVQYRPREGNFRVGDRVRTLSELSWSGFLSELEELLLNGPRFHSLPKLSRKAAQTTLQGLEKALAPEPGAKVQRLDPSILLTFDHQTGEWPIGRLPYFDGWGWDRCWTWQASPYRILLLLNGSP